MPKLIKAAFASDKKLKKITLIYKGVNNSDIYYAKKALKRRASVAYKPLSKNIEVESSFVRLIPYEEYPFIANNIEQFGRIVKEAFSQRRKTIRNTLKSFISENDFEKIGINPQLRAENLSVSDFVKISNYLG